MMPTLPGPGDSWCPPSYFMDDDMENCSDCGGSFLSDDMELDGDDLVCDACFTKRVEKC